MWMWMPRSNDDGRWTRECKLCGASYFQRRPKQDYCSQNCSNKACPGVGGRKPDKSLGVRLCAVCSKEFQPYRDASTCCSTECYRTTEAYAEAQRRSDSRADRRARQNELRRTDPVRAAKVRDYNRKLQLAKYGVTAEEYDRMLAAQGGVCILCGSAPKPDGIRAASKLQNAAICPSGAPSSPTT
jgi:hypothetical protein